MITSLLDNDLYKFTMQHAVVKLFPYAKVRYQFINRAATPFPTGFDLALRAEIDKLAKLKLADFEKDYIARRCYFLDPTYIDFLSGYRYNPAEVTIELVNGQLHINIEGYWYRTILWEVPIMALISELYFKLTNAQPYPTEQIVEIVKQKAELYNKLSVTIADFGTRRRFSFDNHDLVVSTLTHCGKPSFVGTSNVYLAMKYNVTPIGTHAHEWFMYHAASYGFKMANRLALDNWVVVYRGDLGIALADTYTSTVFFKSFDKKLAKLFDGVRQDSGDPTVFADKTIAHYQSLGIDPLSKSIVFSDALDPESVQKIVTHCRGRIKFSFGIGTNFTNDVGVKPLNMVIKLSEVKPEGQDWIPTIKLSDAPGKYTGDPAMIKLCRELLNIKD